MNDFIVDIGYGSMGRILWLLLGKSISNNGLRILNDDKTCEEVVGYLSNGGIMDIFLEGYVPIEPMAYPLNYNFPRDVYLEYIYPIFIHNYETNFHSCN